MNIYKKLNPYIAKGKIQWYFIFILGIILFVLLYVYLDQNLGLENLWLNSKSDVISPYSS
ncbi:MAG: hypothetical protein LAT68_04385 [Cyclobacteriaceae bacterium]|nr:hypothetical protein [Cyclobacteriaceae bacterium]